MGDGQARPELRGRRREGEVLDRLVAGARSGRSQVLVLRGEAGVGKSALLGYVEDRATGCRVERAAGVESEMELAFAGLHQLCTPMLASVERLPEPQRAAIRTALGLEPGPVPDRFLVGLALLGLLADAAEERPLVCLVDDAQWLDRASAQALGFAARRLLAESVALVFAVREPSGGDELDGLADLVVDLLSELLYLSEAGDVLFSQFRIVADAGAALGSPKAHRCSNDGCCNTRISTTCFTR